MTKDCIFCNAPLELPGGLAQVHSILYDIDPAHSDITTPDAQLCITYLPTFTPKTTQM